MTELWKRRLFGLGAILVVVAMLVGLSFGNLGQNVVYYWSPTELVQKRDEAQGQTVRLGGLVMPGTFDLAACDPGCSFRITDGRTEVAVETEGVPPQMFRAGIGVVVEGQLHGDVFRTDRVMIKHSNEYQAPEGGEKPDMAATLEEGT